MPSLSGPDLARNRSRQAEIYGAPLGDRIRRVTGALGVTQARLARALGMSPAMLSQLVSGRRVKIGDPVVLVRLMVLDRRCPQGPPLPSAAAAAVLAEVADTSLRWPGETRPPISGAAPALRALASPARLAAAATVLAPGFPELAEALRRAAREPAPPPTGRRVPPPGPIGGPW